MVTRFTLPALAITGVLTFLNPLTTPLAAAQDASLISSVPTLSVTGRSDLEMEPDELRLVLSVVTEGGRSESVDELTSDNSEKVERILRALEEAGVAEEDIKTGRFNIYPRYERASNRTDPRIVGYRVENEVVVETPLIAEAGRLIERAVDAGANQVSSVSFGLRDEQASRARAIERAAANARSDAEALAAASGVVLTRLLRVNLDQPNVGMSRMDGMQLRSMAESADAAASAPPINPGKVTVRASVTMIYEIEQD
jgi:uncharacterized protein YggE